MTATLTDVDAISCPKCGGGMWDNRLTKKNPKAPDYKCKDRSCEGVIWPPKNGKAPPQSRPAARQEFNAGPDLPGERDEEMDALVVAVKRWNRARTAILHVAPDFEQDLQALNAAIATVIIESRS